MLDRLREDFEKKGVSLSEALARYHAAQQEVSPEELLTQPED